MGPLCEVSHSFVFLCVVVFKEGTLGLFKEGTRFLGLPIYCFDLLDLFRMTQMSCVVEMSCCE